MKLYLSSYGIGGEAARLQEFVPGRRLEFVPNALDFSEADPVRRERRVRQDQESLRDIGLESSILDLRDYFSAKERLSERLQNTRAIFVCGGNVFVLRQAMKLSGLDEMLLALNTEEDFTYAGYSAAGCVLAPTLESYKIVDKPDTPYAGCEEVIWSGLGLVDFQFMPHWDSPHPESAAIQQEIDYCERQGLPYRAIRDGEVIVIE